MLALVGATRQWTRCHSAVRRRTHASTRQKLQGASVGQVAYVQNEATETGTKPTGWDNDQREPLQTYTVNDFK